jgi:Sulfotransferase domain
LQIVRKAMTLPNFVGIGGERCGSTWLHSLLQQHPKIYVPALRKELDFFNLNYEKGLAWYESFFPKDAEVGAYQAIGEISPRYLNFPECAEKLATVQSIKKLFVILRNPIDRAYSHYGHTMRLRGYSKSFEEFLVDYPKATTHGFYADHLSAFLKYYDREQLCCLIFEEAVADVVTAKQQIARFLEVELNEFPVTSGLEKVNETYVPKLPLLNQAAARVRSYLRKSNADWMINATKAIGFQKVLKMGASEGLPPMRQETRLRLLETYAQDTESLEQLLGLKLDGWRSN